MKIDLHLHTKKCKSGDSSNRNIDAQNFVRKMKESNVGISAITNHNHFDLKGYNEIIDEDPELVVFAGIELDIKYNLEDQHHIIVICDPKNKKLFYEIFDDEPQRNYETFYLDYDNFIKKVKKFAPEDIIIIPHFLNKDKKRSLDPAKKDKLIKDLNEYLIILEPGKLQTMGVINAHNELSLIGSDVTDWAKYNQYHLPEIKFKISSFKKFYELAKEPNVFIRNYLHDTTSYSIPVMVNDKSLMNKIEIYNDINIIFGEKGSGKTILLKDYIHPFLRQKGYKTFLHEGKDYNEQYETLINDFANSVEKNEKILNIMKEKFEVVVNYKEDKQSNFIVDFSKYHENSIANKNVKLIKKINSIYSDNHTDSFSSIINNLELDAEKIAEVEEIDQRIRESNSEQSTKLLTQLDSLKDDLNKFAIKSYKKLFISKNVELLLTAIKGSVQKKTGKESKPNNIGFSKLVSNRLERLKANNILMQTLSEIKKHKKFKLGNLPNKGLVTLNISIEVLGDEEKYTERKIFDRNSIMRNRDILKKINNFNITDFKEINGYFKTEEKIESELFCGEIIKKLSRIDIEGVQDYVPSEGEKAIITIAGLLEDDTYDCYLFDEIERGLGQKYITDYIVPKLKDQRDKGKTIIISTHNSNVAINTLPSQTIYCDFKGDSTNIYYLGNQYSNKLTGIELNDELIWKDKALIHLEGSREMFGKRRNIYGI